MDKDPLLIAISIGCIIVLGILAVGIGGFVKGGEFNKKYGNKLMRWRIGAQFAVVVMIVLVIFLRGSGSN